VVVDSGESADSDALLANITKLGFDPAAVQLILNTHWHPDHVGGNRALVERSGAPVMIHEADAEVLETGLFLGRQQDFPPVTVARRLHHTDVIERGGLSFETIHCPGQSSGEVVFLTTVDGPDGPCRCCFAGDAIGFKSSVASFAQWGYPGSTADYRRTLPLLRELRFDLYLGGHPHMLISDAGTDSPFIDRETWLRMIDKRQRAMARFVAEHPEHDS
jgi:glyoxylase-like metal-dependent hydrolase (beta-lactamase superfamily II)